MTVLLFALSCRQPKEEKKKNGFEYELKSKEEKLE